MRGQAKKMKICGLNKTTMLDYPGRLAATVFLGGCNFCCPFCHNGPLVIAPEKAGSISEQEILKFLEKRRGILEGVCITGGEPTIYKELPRFLLSVRKLGYQIKLDTNGTNPGMVKELEREGLIDMVAMDIKAAPDNYIRAAGVQNPSMEAVFETADYLLHGQLDYEFRTTAVKGIHTREDFMQIGKWIKGAKAYFLQSYRESQEVLCPGFESFTREELLGFLRILQAEIPNAAIRGVD